MTVRCDGTGMEAHLAHLDVNGECPWCGAVTDEVATQIAKTNARQVATAKALNRRLVECGYLPGSTWAERKVDTRRRPL